MLFQYTVVTLIECRDISVVVYLDDIVIHEMDPECIWAEIQLVLKQFATAGFMINTTKWHFLVSEMKALEYQFHRGNKFLLYM